MTTLKRPRRSRPAVRAAAVVAGLGTALLSAALVSLAAPAVAQAAAASISENVTTVAMGGNIVFTYTAPAASPYDYVVVIPAGAPATSASIVGYANAPLASGTVAIASSSLNGVGSYEAFLANEATEEPIAGPVAFTVTASNPAPAPAFAGVIGAGQLSGPYGVATDAAGNIWVADTGADRIVEFSAAGRQLAVLGAQAGLREPEGVAIDAAGNIWVADTGNNRVVELSPSGRVLTVVGPVFASTGGSGTGQFNRPVAITVSGTTVYVADQLNSRVEEFTTAGVYAASVSVSTPGGLAVDGSGNLWVTSPGNNTVTEFSAAGAQLQQFGSTQAGYGDMSNPNGIAIGPDGRVYVVQGDYSWVTVFNTDGTFYTEFGLQTDASLGAENLNAPQSLAITSTGTIYVADTGNDRVVAFTPAGAGSAAPAAALAPAVPPVSPSRPADGGPSPVELGGISLGGLLLLAAGAWTVIARRRRNARPAPAAPALAAPVGPAVPVSCEKPDPATQEPFAAVQQRIATAEISRRRLLVSATALSGVAAGGAALPKNLRKMLATTPHGLNGKLSDIEHIVILMQENRSFDHYFGTMPGVRGFQDPTAITLSTGNSVFYQPDASHADGYLTPFHYDTKSTSAQATPGTDHSWQTQHQAWDNGAMDAWVPAKGEFTMGYFTQDDIPFHWALAQAFTLCDNYHCSVLGPTNPNRLYMWSGMIDPNGTGGGPVIDNSEAVPYTWSTYPERLEAAGISWQVYQEFDNYDDNALAWFKVFQNAPQSSSLWRRGMQMRPAGWFEADARAGRLPQVSWIVAPSSQSEHPDYYPAAGAQYIASKLDAIAANENLWRTTLFILCYDENDGIFDHVAPPTAPSGTPDEFVTVGGVTDPIGLGFRVPATIVSPWTAGGNVYSGVLDHTSLIRVIEARWGVSEPNISAWRRATTGDFTQALRFSGTPADWPRQNQAISLAAADADLLTAQQETWNLPRPVIPTVNEPIPTQD